MKLTVNATELNEALNIVTRALAPRAAKQILEGVLLEAIEGNEGHLSLTCSDGKLSIDSSLSAMVLEGGRAVLPGRLFSELSRKLPGGEVTITVNDSFGAEITCARSRTKLAGMDPAEYPEMADVDSNAVEIEIPQRELKRMVNGVLFSIATDESRQILTGSLLEVSPTEARMVALDGFRLALQGYSAGFELPEGVEILKAIIPGKVMNELGRVLSDGEEPCVLSFDKNHMSAEFGNSRLCAALLAGDFIDYRRILPASFKTTAMVDRLTLMNALDRASVMAREGKNNLVKLHFGDQVLRIMSNAEIGDQGDEMDVSLDGDPLDIAFNAKYIMDAVRNISEDTLCMNFNTSVSPCVIRPNKGEGFIYLILPVRVF